MVKQSGALKISRQKKAHNYKQTRFFRLVFESPRWLIANKRYKEAKSIVEELLKSLGNNIDFEEVQVLRENADG